MARCLLLAPDAEQWCHFDACAHDGVIFSHTDWSLCKATRRSTIGGIMTYKVYVIQSCRSRPKVESLCRRSRQR